MKVRISAACRTPGYDGRDPFSLECELEGGRIRRPGRFIGTLYYEGEPCTFEFDPDGDLIFVEDGSTWTSNLLEWPIDPGELFTIWDSDGLAWTYQIEIVAPR